MSRSNYHRLTLDEAEALARHYQDIAAARHTDTVWAKIDHTHGRGSFECITTHQHESRASSAMARYWLDVCMILQHGEFRP